MADGDLPLFHRLYGTGHGVIPPEVAAIHAVHTERVWHGEAMVERGGGWLASAICWAVGFPPEAENVPLTITMTREGTGEVWRRRFGRAKLDSRFCPSEIPSVVIETLGPFAACSRLDCDADGVNQVLVRLTVFGVPVSPRVWPRLDVRESADLDRYRFSVRMRFPWGADLISYQGTLGLS